MKVLRKAGSYYEVIRDCCGRRDMISRHQYNALLVDPSILCIRCRHIEQAPWSATVTKTGRMVEAGEPRLEKGEQ